MRTSPLILALLTLPLLLGPSGALAEEPDGDPDPFDAPLPALLGGREPELDRIYRGISKGLEQCALAKSRPEYLADDAEKVLTRLEAEKPPLLFVVGPRAVELLGERLAGVPRVFVDMAWEVDGKPVPSGPVPAAPAAVVRGRRSAVWVASALRAAFAGERPWAALSWEAKKPSVAEAAGRLADAAGFRLWQEGAKSSPQVLLHLRLGLGEEVPGLPALLDRARTLKVPLVSDDLAHWTRGAAVLVLPDYQLLGRVAAEMGRRLLKTEGEPRVLRRDVRLVQVWVDLRAARAQGLELPIPFLAGVDRLRGAPPRRAPEGGR